MENHAIENRVIPDRVVQGLPVSNMLSFKFILPLFLPIWTWRFHFLGFKNNCQNQDFFTMIISGVRLDINLNIKIIRSITYCHTYASFQVS